MADMTYIKLFVDYLDAIEPLGDAERGRLFTSLLEYARTGEAPQLGGNERFLFPMMRAQIDRDNAAMTELSEARSKAGKIGAEAKQANAGFAKQNKHCGDGGQFQRSVRCRRAHFRSAGCLGRDTRPCSRTDASGQHGRGGISPCVLRLLPGAPADA